MNVIAIKIKLFLVASQSYNTYVTPEEVIAGNDAIVKCTIPSFVIDFVSITAWVDSEGFQHLANNVASSYGNLNPPPSPMYLQKSEPLCYY